MSKNSVGFLRNLRSKIDPIFSVRIVDDHYVIRVAGLKFCKKFPYKYEFKEVNKTGITTEKRNPRVIISLTTFPARINVVYKTISTLMQQTVKADEIILQLADSQFPNRELPDNLIRLCDFGLTIKWCEDTRSYKKLIPTLAEYPEDIIITVDDDYYYDKDLVKTLLEEHDKHPNCIIGGRAMQLVSRKNNKYKLKRRSYIYDDSYLPSFLNPFIGFGGVLYPPHSLHNDVFDKDKFMKIIPTNDDAWFWINAVRNGTKFVPCKNGYHLKYYTIENSQNVGLYQVNGNNSTNGIGGEEAASMFLDMYPEARANIEAEKK